MSVLYCLLLDTYPLNHIYTCSDSVIRLQVNQFCEYHSLCALQAILKDTELKRVGEEADLLPLLLKRLFQGHTGLLYQRVISWLFTQHTTGNESSSSFEKPKIWPVQPATFKTAPEFLVCSVSRYT